MGVLPSLNNRFALLMVVIFIAGAYGFFSSRMDVGYFNDDARYILSAKSLTQGSFRDLELPGHPANVDRFPGYPAFLAPFVAAVAPHWFYLKLTSIILSIASLFLLISLYREALNPFSSIVLVAVVALNPTFMKYSCSVMSEPLFLALILLTLILYKNWIKSGRDRTLWLAGLALTGASLVRPEGVTLGLALLVSLGIAHQSHKIWKLISIPCVAGAVFIVRNVSVGGTPTGYLQQGGDILAYLQGRIVPLMVNAVHFAKVVVVDSLFQAAFPISLKTAQWGLWFVVILLAIGLMIVGLRNLWMASGKQRSLHAGVAMFIFLYGSIHSLFLAVNSRYAFPVIPFMALFLIQGVAVLLQRWNQRPAIFVGLLSSWFFLYSTGYSSPVDKLWFANDTYQISRTTYAWIRQHTPADAFFLATKSSTLTLETGRYALTVLQAEDLEELRYQLITAGVTHLLVAPNRLTVLHGKRFTQMLDYWITASAWLSQWPEAYEKVYENSEERTVIYRVIPDRHYSQAFVACRQADMDFSMGEWKAGFEKLAQALAVYPRFVGALNRSGMAVERFRHDDRLAEAYYRKAVAISPTCALAWVNLSNVRRRLGDNKNADAYRMKAQDLLSAGPSFSGAKDVVLALLRHSSGW